MERLDDLRLKIDLIDNDLINLFKKRIEIVKKIKLYKLNNNIEVSDLKREEEIYNSIKDNFNDENLESYLKFMESIIAISKEIELK